MGEWRRRLAAPSNLIVRESWLTILGSRGELGHVFFNLRNRNPSHASIFGHLGDAEIFANYLVRNHLNADIN